MKSSLAIALAAAVALLATAGLTAQSARKPRVSVVAGLEASGQNGSSAFGTENAQTVLAMVNAYAVDSGVFEVIASADREAAMRELEFSLSMMAEDANQLQLGKMLAAERILSARCGRAGDYFVVQLSLTDVQSGAALGSALGKYRNMGTLLESLRSLVNDCLGIEAPDEQGKVRFISVRNATEFLNALGSDRVVTLEPGVYDLTGRNDVRSANLGWKDNYDGFYPVARSVSNLTLRSSQPGAARIVIAPAYGWILEFQTSRGLRFQGIEFVHTKPGYCLGGVLRFELCDGIEILDCSLDGSGTYGLELSGSRNFSMDRSRIRNCTYGIMQFSDSSDAIFKDCEFVANGEFDLFGFANSTNIDFSGCLIRDNRGESLVSADAASYGITFSDCRVTANQVRRLTDNADRVRFLGVSEK